jgi:hypothetical protein
VGKTRHRRRFHTDRVVRNRRARFLRETPDARPDDRRLSYGRLADRDPWDCGSRCWLCHYDKLLGYPRAQETRAWQRDWL